MRAIARTMRLPFLILTPTCVFLGASAAMTSRTNVSLWMLVPVLLGALAAHVSVNTLNEYHDYKSGLDFMTIRTSFSGGSGALPQHPEMLNTVFAVGSVSLGITVIIGSFFIWKHGPGIVPIGILGLLLVVFYTQWINKHPLLCLVAPGAGFGFLMVVGTQFVLKGEYETISWVVAVVPFFLVNNLLLLNQYPDIEADAGVGRNHFPIAYGIKNSNIAYSVFILAATALIVACILVGYFPVLSVIALFPIPLAFVSLYGAIKYGDQIGQVPHYLAVNVVVTILTPLLLGVSLIYSSHSG